MTYVNGCCKIQIFIEFEDYHYKKKVDAEVAVVAVADSTGLSEAVYNDVTPDEAKLGSGGEELPVRPAFDVQDMPLVQEGETKATPEEGLLVFK